MSLLKSVLILAFICLPMLPAFAANPSVLKASRRNNSSQIPAPQVIRPGDSLLGLRGAMGGTFEGSTILGLNYEYILQRNIGLGAQVHHAGYSTKFGNANFNGEYSYNIWVLNAYGALHADLFKVKKLDTYATAGVGRTFVSSSVKSNQADLGPGADITLASATTSAFFLTANLNARYFFTDNLSGVATLGLGLGTLGLGMDYLF